MAGFLFILYIPIPDNESEIYSSFAAGLDDTISKKPQPRLRKRKSSISSTFRSSNSISSNASAGKQEANRRPERSRTRRPSGKKDVTHHQGELTSTNPDEPATPAPSVICTDAVDAPPIVTPGGARGDDSPARKHSQVALAKSAEDASDSAVSAGTLDRDSKNGASGYDSDSESGSAANDDVYLLSTDAENREDVAAGDAADAAAAAPSSPGSPKLVDFLENVPLAHVLKQAMGAFKITNDTWMKVRCGKIYQVTFAVKTVEHCEELLNKLTGLGVGRTDDSSMCVIPLGVSYGLSEVTSATEEEESQPNQQNFAAEKPDDSENISRTKLFMKSIKSRLTVAQVVESVKAQTVMSFDFIMLTVLASIIAAMGLCEDSSVVLVASMLISPLMGPILGGTFGTVIKDTKLRNASIITELVGIAICIITGFIFALMVSGLSDSWGSGYWPTYEMKSRGMLRSWYVGLMIALPSGAGVALSVLGGNTGSLVGVAISASLLPPAVNCGFLWGFAVVKKLTSLTYPCANIIAPPEGSSCRQPEYAAEYSDSLAAEALMLGAVSLVLTLLNIICIFVMGVVVLKIKEVAPYTSQATTRNFWKQDIKIARDYNQTVKGEDSIGMGKQLLEELKSQAVTSENTRLLDQMLQELEEDDVYRTALFTCNGVPQRSIAYRERFLTSRPLSLDSSVCETAAYGPARADRNAPLQHQMSLPHGFLRTQNVYMRGPATRSPCRAGSVREGAPALRLPRSDSAHSVSIARFTVTKLGDGDHQGAPYDERDGCRADVPLLEARGGDRTVVQFYADERAALSESNV
ncbi:PREDICTED: uncharacterized protein LOC106804679 [Priapulus caudatus]|uniref:Uncharacterized protein LOC106804679 n=1 Tax=Priapulus caudatus TaxID=37621 RepID=A0ABM1DNB9_PRICU|nr:PREDICTED: uncharacterized protein LOC106804679 [Priapulus caudatus]